MNKFFWGISTKWRLLFSIEPKCKMWLAIQIGPVFFQIMRAPKSYDLHLVISPSHDDFEEFIAQDSAEKEFILQRGAYFWVSGNTEYRWISHPDSMRGYHNVKVSFTPSAFERFTSWELKEFQDLAVCARMR